MTETFRCVFFDSQCSIL